MKPLKPLTPLGAPQGMKPLAPLKPVGAPAPIKPVEKVEEKPKANHQDVLFGHTAEPTPPAQPTTAEVKETAKQVANQVVEQVENKVKAATEKKQSGKAKKEEDTEKKPSVKYEGPRHVKVYGQLLFTENDPKVTPEQIRERIVTEFGFEEFSASRAKHDLDEETGIMVWGIPFQKKG